jgi:hypothetical protein
MIDPSKVVRVSEQAFRNIPNFPYKPRFGHYQGLRYAFIDEESACVLHDGRAAPLTDLPSGKEVHWETFLCLQ